MKTPLLVTLIGALLVSSPATAQYSARRNGTRVELEDGHGQIVVSIDPAAGNVTTEMKVKGHNVLAPQGIPFMAPWANRLDEQAFYANGRRYAFNMELGNVKGAHPIHGFLGGASQWEVVETAADGSAAMLVTAVATSRTPSFRR